jgi:hypothetical protein
MNAFNSFIVKHQDKNLQGVYAIFRQYWAEAENSVPSSSAVADDGYSGYSDLDDSLPLPDGEDDADDHSGALDESLADDASEINNTELDPSEPGHDRDVIDLDSQPTEEAWTDAQPRPKDELWMSSPEYEKDVEASEAEIAEMKKESMPALEVESMTGSMPALQVESAGSMPPLEVESEKAGMAPLEVESKKANMEPLEVEPKKADMAPLEVESKKADMAPLEVGSKKAIAESMPPPPVPVKKSASLTLGSVTIRLPANPPPGMREKYAKLVLARVEQLE